MHINTNVSVFIYGYMHTATHIISDVIDYHSHMCPSSTNKISALKDAWHQSRGLPKISMISPTPTLPQVPCGSALKFGVQKPPETHSLKPHSLVRLVSKLWDAEIHSPEKTHSHRYLGHPEKEMNHLPSHPFSGGKLSASGKVSTASLGAFNCDIFQTKKPSTFSLRWAATLPVPVLQHPITCRKKRQWFDVIGSSEKDVIRGDSYVQKCLKKIMFPRILVNKSLDRLT